MKLKKLGFRLGAYFLGLFVIALGVVISVKSDLGVSPVSSIPYTLTCIFGLELGKATILFHSGLVLIQFLILGKLFSPKNLLQVPVSIVFGYFTTFCGNILSGFLVPDSMFIRLVLSVISTVVIAFGLHLYVPADLIPMGSEGVMLAVSKRFGFEFSNVKIGFDVTVVLISLIACLAVLHSLGSVGIGTVLSAFLVGINLKLIRKMHRGFVKSKG